MDAELEMKMAHREATHTNDQNSTVHTVEEDPPSFGLGDG